MSSPSLLDRGPPLGGRSILAGPSTQIPSPSSGTQARSRVNSSGEQRRNSNAGTTAGTGARGANTATEPTTSIQDARRERRKRRREERIAKELVVVSRELILTSTKLKFLSEFIRALDMVAYYYFAYMYFRDNAFFLFIIRCAMQLNFLTPKPATILAPPQQKSVVVCLFGWAGISMMFHLLAKEPSAGEEVGAPGYLHGSLLIDFVGQEGPVSKLRLLTTDITILLIQLVMLSLNHEKQTLRIQNRTQTLRKAFLEQSGENGEGIAQEPTRGLVGLREQVARSIARGTGGLWGARQTQMHAQTLDEEERGLVVGWDEDLDSESDESQNHERGADVDGEETEDEDGWRTVALGARNSERRALLPSDSGRPREGSGTFSSNHRSQATATASSAVASASSRNHEPSTGAGDVVIDIDGPDDSTRDTGIPDDDGGRYAAYSGQLVVASVNIVEAVMKQWMVGSSGSYTALRSPGDGLNAGTGGEAADV